MHKSNRCFHWLVFLWFGCASLAMAADYQLAEWEQMNDASYYQGQITVNGKMYTIRTARHSILIPSNASFEKVTGFGPLGQPRRTVPVKISAKPVDELVAAKPEPKKTLPNPTPAPKPEPKKVERPDDGSEEPDFVIPENYGDQPSAWEEKLNQPEAEDRSDGKVLASLTTGLGFQSVVAKGGAAQMDSRTAIGGNEVQALYDTPGDIRFYQAGLEAHNYAFNSRGTRKKFLQMQAQFLVGFDVDRDAPLEEGHHIKLGLGATFFNNPGIEIKDNITKDAELKNVSLFGPMIELFYQYDIDPRTHWDNTAGIMPFSMSELAGSRLNVRSMWRREVLPRWSGLAGMQLLRQTSVEHVDCGGAADCHSNARSVSQMMQVLVGLQWEDQRPYAARSKPKKVKPAKKKS